MIDPNARQIVNVRRSDIPVTFKCQRCAVFCCRLGAPKLLRKDIERLEQAGHRAGDFLDRERGSIKSKEDGSCIFLSAEETSRFYKCAVHDFRPILCQLYPFRFENSTGNLCVLRVIPCCNGLNVRNGEIVGAKFAAMIADSALFEMIDAGMI